MNGRPLVISCGILRREIEYLMDGELPAAETVFLPSQLHFNFEAFEEGLQHALEEHTGRGAVVVYGSCHPAIDPSVSHGGCCRVPCQNCVELLLGPEEFNRELEAGAYFLLEEWAMRWDDVLAHTFGDVSIAREIFQADRSHLLAIQTPCSGDFTREAESAAASVGLPLQFRTIRLDHLKQCLQQMFSTGSGPA